MPEDTDRDEGQLADSSEGEAEGGVVQEAFGAPEEAPAEGAPGDRSDHDLPELAATALDLPRVAGFRLELVLDPERSFPGVYPFVALGLTGRYARVHLARIVSESGDPIRYLALKIQRDRYDDEAEGGAPGVLSNVAIAGLWANEYRNLRELGSEGPAAAMLELAANENGEVPTFEPAIYCREVGRFFHPPCPSCGSTMTDCKDDRILTDHGLPQYSESNVRYLYCAACAAGSRELTFYRLQVTDRESRRGIRDLQALLGDLAGPALGGSGPGDSPRPERPRSKGQRSSGATRPPEGEGASEGSPPARDGEALAAFPCRRCDLRGECYQPQEGAAPKALERLVPLSFYEFRFLALDMLRLHYHEFADILGGICWDEFIEAHRGSHEGLPEKLLLGDLRSHLSRPDRFLFSGDTSGAFAVEVLKLKMALFTRFIRRLHQVHLALKTPHLDVKPENVLVFLPALSAETPHLWNFDVKLIDLAITNTFLCGDGSTCSILTPPQNYPEIYTSPIIKDGHFGHLSRCELSFSELRREDDGTCRILAQLRSETLNEKDFTDKDLFRVAVNKPEVGAPLDFWARKSRERQAGAGLLDVISEPQRLEPAQVAAIEHLGRRRLRDVPFQTYHAFHVPCDVYSAGMILFRTILFGRDQNMARIRGELLDPVVSDIVRFRNEEPKADRARMEEFACNLLAAREPASVRYVFYDGDPGRPSSIPDRLWQSILVLGLRMVTNIDGFSFARDRGDYDECAPEALIGGILADLEPLNAQIHTVLFGRQGVNEEVREAIAVVRGRRRKQED